MPIIHLTYMKTIETHARAFLTLNILAIGRVAKVSYLAPLASDFLTPQAPLEVKGQLKVLLVL